MRTTAFARPTTEDLHDHLVGLLFGFDDHLSGVILAAYGDLARTLGGISAHPNSASLKKDAVALLRASLPKGVSSASDREKFDDWHQATCISLREIYLRGQFDRFSIGHSQKWVNMAVKYLVLLEDRAVPGAADLLPVAHMPLDSIILGVLKRDYDLSTNSCEPWSKIPDYEIYMDLQNRIRSKFHPSYLLSAELQLWRPETDASHSGGRQEPAR
ncbi:MAG TPA: hypothetical protein PLL76_04860 [Thermoanaerobaculia bacterium]|nr:hypothetical protein [Thermoanaerobaculia bacterium]